MCCQGDVALSRCCPKKFLCKWKEVESAPCLLRAARTVLGSSHESPPMLVDTSVSMWMEKDWLPFWPLSKNIYVYLGLYTVSRCRKRGKSEDHTGENALKGIHPGFETQGRRHQKSNVISVQRRLFVPELCKLVKDKRLNFQKVPNSKEQKYNNKKATNNITINEVTV